MDEQVPQFVGPPCGQYGTHTFYRGFQYSKQGKTKEIGLGEFFFVRISAAEDPCIGELQLLCSNKNNDQQLSALRLYFLPEQTPEGRLSHHGEHELLVASDRMVLRLDDLVGWITDEVEWNHGIEAPHVAKKEVKSDLENDDNNNSTVGVETTTEGATDDADDQKKVAEVKEEGEKENSTLSEKDGGKGPQVLVLSYQSYCRYRTILKRIDGGDSDEWMQDALVLALGGLSPPSSRTRVLFCRDSFEHDELAHHELNCEYLAPTIKGKKKKKKTKNARCGSPESNTSEECKAVEIKANQKASGVKQPPIKNEQEFLQRLFKFMKKRNTPIHRVPHLGFKQIDLYVFYSFAQKLGGYDKITTKKLWKHVYDELGGNPGSTSAATCTRRHYEKLLLPFERFMYGIAYKPAQRGKKSQKKKLQQEQDQQQQQTQDSKEQKNEVTDPVPSTSKAGSGVESTAVEDAYAFTDSNNDNSNSNNSNEDPNSAADEQALANETPFSDEDSKTVWSIQKQPDSKDEASQDKDDGKPIKPLIIQKGQSESFADKERQWDVIRKRSAATRKMVRQTKSNRGGKALLPPPVKLEKPAAVVEAPVPDPSATLMKSEIPPHPTVLPPPSQEKPLQLADIKPLPIVDDPAVTPSSNFLPPVEGVEIKLENHSHKRRHVMAKETPSHVSSNKKLITVKAVNEKRANNWLEYSSNSPVTSPYQAPLKAVLDRYSPGASRVDLPPNCKPGVAPEEEVARDHSQPAGRRSVSSVSASSVASMDAPGEDKPTVPQRRPSVIQHTEYAATSPSPSLSPKQSVPDASRNVSPKDAPQTVVPYPNPKMAHPVSGQLGYAMTGKVAEWLTKGASEVVACKTPSAVMDKSVELHDKVMVPSSCKTPGVTGTSKASSVNSAKSKQSASKSQRSKYSSHRHRNSDGVVNGNYPTLPRNDVRNNNNNSAVHQRLHQPIHPVYPAVPSNVPKYSRQSANQKAKAAADFYPNGLYYNQPKRFKANNVVPPMMPPVNVRPAQSPFARQQTYCTPPMSDIPRTAAATHNDYESAVLDLSVRKRPAIVPPPVRTVAPPISPEPQEGVCLDLSLKKKPISNNNNNLLPTDNGIENITPPLPISPNPPSMSPYMHSTLKPLPTMVSLHDLAAEEAARRGFSTGNGRIPPIMSSTATSQVSGPPLGIPQMPALYPGSGHGKLPSGLVNTLPPMAYSKEMAKNLYMPGSTRHSQFPPYVINPAFFGASWAPVMNPTTSKQGSNSQTSPMTYKGMVNHNVFPKDYPYKSSSQYHSVLCKDGGRYPSNDNK